MPGKPPIIPPPPLSEDETLTLREVVQWMAWSVALFVLVVGAAIYFLGGETPAECEARGGHWTGSECHITCGGDHGR